MAWPVSAFIHPSAVQGVLLLFLGVHARASRPSCEEDRVWEVPGFGREPFPFKLYSGILEVPGPVCGYDSLRINYQFETSQGRPAKDPLVVWQQGGPGASSVVGAYSEMGFFRLGVSADGAPAPFRNPWAWNRLANMLYMDGPAGSGNEASLSQCVRGGVPVACAWNDTSQAEAFAHALRAFYRMFPDEADKDLYITGESYFGQYGTNIARYILGTEPFSSSFNLKGIGLGNACHGGNETFVMCPGFNVDKNTVEFYWRQDFISPKFYRDIQAACSFPPSWVGEEVITDAKCKMMLDKMNEIVAHNNILFLRDTCDTAPPESTLTNVLAGESPWRLDRLPPKRPKSLAQVKPGEMRKGPDGQPPYVVGGYPYACLDQAVISRWLVSPKVRKALHLEDLKPGSSSFSYELSGPAAITLYPELMKKIQVLIYNGDSDSLAIYPADQEWIEHFEAESILEEDVSWTAWHTNVLTTPAGFRTRYAVLGSDQHFTFMTVKGSGHMVPQITPEAGLGVLAAVLGVDLPTPQAAEAMYRRREKRRGNPFRGQALSEDSDGVAHLQLQPPVAAWEEEEEQEEGGEAGGHGSQRSEL